MRRKQARACWWGRGGAAPGWRGGGRHARARARTQAHARTRIHALSLSFFTLTPHTLTTHSLCSAHAHPQMGVALYFLDKLALRAGHEKDEDEADTVGQGEGGDRGWGRGQGAVGGGQGGRGAGGSGRGRRAALRPPEGCLQAPFYSHQQSAAKPHHHHHHAPAHTHTPTRARTPSGGLTRPVVGFGHRGFGFQMQRARTHTHARTNSHHKHTLKTYKHSPSMRSPTPRYENTVDVDTRVYKAVEQFLRCDEKGKRERTLGPSAGTAPHATAPSLSALPGPCAGAMRPAALRLCVSSALWPLPLLRVRCPALPRVPSLAQHAAARVIKANQSFAPALKSRVLPHALSLPLSSSLPPALAGKQPRDMLFDTFDATDLNKELKGLMDGLSVKVRGAVLRRLRGLGEGGGSRE